MWGDPEAAIHLQASDALASLLFQITGPAHIPLQDQRWQELLHGYNVWVHTESRDTGILRQACTSFMSHAPQSSNLAAFCMHITRMIGELTPVNTSAATATTSGVVLGSGVSVGGVNEFSSRIALVGKARVAAGSLNLFRILTHAVIVHSTSEQVPAGYLQECFTYKSRETTKERDTGGNLLAALFEYISSNPSLSATVPELYDATVLSLELLLVLLASQLYEPMLSSFQRHAQTPTGGASLSSPDVGMFWVQLMQQRSITTRNGGDSSNSNGNHSSSSSSWTPSPRRLVQILLEWTVHRPPAPPRSIAHHTAELVKSVVKAKGETLSSDGMYESHVVVTAAAATAGSSSTSLGASHETAIISSGGRDESGSPASKALRRHGNILLDATKGVLVLSSSIILLPFRLMSLALGLWGHSKERGYDQAHKKFLNQQSQLTKDVMWLSDSCVADLASCLLLLLIHNERAGSNPFRNELMALTDNRWESDEPGSGFPDLPDLPVMNEEAHDESVPLMDLASPPPPIRRSPSARQADVLAFNFESLFESFGRTAHTEVGALLLYSLMQSSQTFAESIAVRSDLDTLVLPLLRTLYFSSSLRYYAAQDYASRRTTAQQSPRRSSNDSISSQSTAVSTVVVSIRSCPFRSQSQLYVIIILLLLFSQDLSFGTDAFRRVHVSTVLWYKERYLKDINLGSIMLLCILRSLTFNLSRLHDSFLLSNCCAILMNLAPNITDLHEYAAMRLVAMTLAAMKRYMVLRRDHPDNDEDLLSTPTAMHGEVSRTLLRVLKQSLSSKNVDRNLNLVYALVYHQTDWKKQTGQKDSPFKKSEVDRINQVISTSSSIFEKGGETRTAAKALKLLAENMDQIREVVADKRRREVDAFTFTYEEEADPETFFVPYIWEVIVCVATASLIEWNKRHIQVFPLLEDPRAEHPFDPPESVNPAPSPSVAVNFSKDVLDVV